MTTDTYDTMRRRECNEIIPREFHVSLPAERILFDDIETGPNSYAVMFQSKKDVYVLLVAKDGHRQTLGDVQRIVKGMGLEAERYFPPAADPRYFYREGVKHFKKLYPARKKWTTSDVRFYQSLADYGPALVRVASINGEVRRYNMYSKTWQKVFDYSFRKIQVS